VLKGPATLLYGGGAAAGVMNVVDGRLQLISKFGYSSPAHRAKHAATRNGRLCESTETSDEEEAARYLVRRIEEIRQAAIYGTRPRRKLREGATRYLAEFAWKRSIEGDARALKDLDPFVGDVWLDCVHNDSFKAHIDTRRNHPPTECKPLAAGTINRNLAVARRILNLAARLWRDKGSTLTWLAQAPLIQLSSSEEAASAQPDTPGLAVQSDSWVRIDFQRIANKY